VNRSGGYTVGYIIGSLSAASMNRKLSKALIRLAPDNLTFVEIPIRDLPMYNRDFDDDYPPVGRALKDAIAAVDAVLFVTPEDNRGLPGGLKNVGLLSHSGAARRAMANAVEEVKIGYEGSPIATGDRPDSAKVAAGQYLPYVHDPAVYKQLRAVFGADNLGHTVVTIASEHPAPAAGGEGRLQVLVTRDNAPVPGYDTVIADPSGALAERLGLTNGGRVVVRPDGYIGTITTLNDTTAIADYFARVAS
jgi:hypothetical protein